MAAGRSGVRGVVYPRLGSGSRVFWRDIHAVTGFWISGLALFLLFSGLPWAKFWGDYLKAARRLTGTAVARQDWTNGAASPAEMHGVPAAPERPITPGAGGRGGARHTPSDLTAARPDRRDRPPAGTGPAGGHRAARRRLRRLDGEIDDPQPHATGRPRG